MATMESTADERMERRTEEAGVGGSVIETIAGAGAVVLPILGLVGVWPVMLAAISFIAIGAAMMLQGGSASAQVASVRASAGRSASERSELVGGMSAEVLGGAATAALGILALVQIAPMSLLPIAAIVAGGAMVLGAGTTARLGSYRYGGERLDSTTREVLHQSVNAAAGADVLVGLGAVVLGILVLAGVGGAAIQGTLVLVAALALGGALVLNGTTVGARMAALLRH